MMKIVVDSGCDMPLSVALQNDIKAAPLTLQLGDDIYIDDDSLDVNAYIEAMEDYPGTPKTSAPSPQEFLERFSGDNVFVVTLSSKLSGTYNSAMLAKDIYMEEIGNRFVHVFDSLSASVAQYMIVEKILELGKSFEGASPEKIVEGVNEYIKNLNTYFVIERFDNLAKTGRVKPWIAKIASTLSVKAICKASEGEIAIEDKARGWNKAIPKLADLVCAGDNFENRILAISHVKALEKARKLKEEVQRRVNFKDIVILECAGLTSTYASRGALILSWSGSGKP